MTSKLGQQARCDQLLGQTARCDQLLGQPARCDQLLGSRLVGVDELSLAEHRAPGGFVHCVGGGGVEESVTYERVRVVRTQRRLVVRSLRRTSVAIIERLT